MTLFSKTRLAKSKLDCGRNPNSLEHHFQFYEEGSIYERLIYSRYKGIHDSTNVIITIIFGKTVLWNVEISQ